MGNTAQAQGHSETHCFPALRPKTQLCLELVSNKGQHCTATPHPLTYLLTWTRIRGLPHQPQHRWTERQPQTEQAQRQSFFLSLPEFAVPHLTTSLTHGGRSEKGNNHTSHKGKVLDNLTCQQQGCRKQMKEEDMPLITFTINTVAQPTVKCSPLTSNSELPMNLFSLP